MSKIVKCYIALGSNIDNPILQLRAGVQKLGMHPAIVIDRLSKVYETIPEGFKEQPNFFNMVVEVGTSLSPFSLLIALQNIEFQQGRVKTVVNGPRSLDLDILLYGNKVIKTEKLIVPHARMWQRSFVLYPLYETARHLFAKTWWQQFGYAHPCPKIIGELLERS